MTTSGEQRGRPRRVRSAPSAAACQPAGAARRPAGATTPATRSSQREQRPAATALRDESRSPPTVERHAAAGGHHRGPRGRERRRSHRARRRAAGTARGDGTGAGADSAALARPRRAGQNTPVRPRDVARPVRGAHMSGSSFSSPRPWRSRSRLAALAIVVGRRIGLPRSRPPADARWQAYWRAGSAKDAAREAERLIAAGVTFDDAWTRLKAGRTYAAAPTGERNLRATGPGGLAFDNYIEVPATYDPSRRWPVRVQLHGGVDRQNPEEGRRRRANRLPGEPQIVVHPFGWSDAAWWHAPQVDNILSLVDRVKRQYNVDESHVYLTGTSDGAHRRLLPGHARADAVVVGAAAHRPPRRAGQSVDRRRRRSVRLEPRQPAVLRRQRDARSAVSGGARRAVPRGAGHGRRLAHVPSAGHRRPRHVVVGERAAGLRGLRARPSARRPHPALLSWTTERTDRYNRIQWLVIDELGVRASDAALADINTVCRALRRRLRAARRFAQGERHAHRAGDRRERRREDGAGRGRQDPRDRRPGRSPRCPTSWRRSSATPARPSSSWSIAAASG